MNRTKYPEPFKRGGRYYFAAWIEGKRRNIATGAQTKEDAKDFITEYMARNASGIGLTFRRYAESFFIWPTCPRVKRLLAEGKQIGEVHVKHSRRYLERFIFKDKEFSEFQMRDIRRHHVLDLRDRIRARLAAESLHGKGIGKNTANKAIETVKTVLSEAYYREEIATNPGSRIGKIDYEPTERAVLSKEETAALLARRPGEMRTNPQADALITMLATTGARSGEVRALRRGSVDLETGRMQIVEAFKDNMNKTVGLPKWSKPREIILPQIAVEKLRAWKKASQYIRDEDFVLATIDGKAIGVTGIKNKLQRVMEAAEEKKVILLEGRKITPHCFRHSLNSHLLAEGLSPLLVQSYLGWTSAEGKLLTRVQAKYTHFQLMKMEDVAEMINKIYSKPKAAKAKAG